MRYRSSLKGFDDEVITNLNVWNANPTVDAHIGGVSLATIEYALFVLCLLPVSLLSPEIALIALSLCTVSSLLSGQPQKKWYQIVGAQQRSGQVLISASFNPALQIQSALALCPALASDSSRI